MSFVARILLALLGGRISFFDKTPHSWYYIEHYGAKALLIGGGVIANTHIRRAFEQLVTEVNVSLFIPEKNLTTDNALMIAVAGFLRLSRKNGLTKARKGDITAKGNLALDEK